MIWTKAIALLVLLATATPTTTAYAAPKRKRARAYFKKGEAAYAGGRYAEALRFYLKAYELQQLNGFHFNIGLCYRKLGRYSKAISHLTSYIEGSSSPAHRRRARILIKACEDDQKAARRRVAQRQGSDVDGKDGGGSAQVDRPAGDPVDGDGDDSDRRGGGDDRRDDDGAARRKGWHPAVFFTGLGLTVALAGVGGITGWQALDKSARFKDPATPDADLKSLSDSGKRMKLISTISFVAAGVVAAGTLAAFIATDFSDSNDDSSVGAAPLPGGLVVSYGGRF